MGNEERLDEIEEEIAALRGACEQYEEAVGLMAELLTSVAMAIPRPGAEYRHAADRIDRVLAHRDAMAGKPLGDIPRRIVEQVRNDLSSLAAPLGAPPDPASPTRARFRVIQGGKNP